MPLGFSCGLEGFLDFVYELSGRGRCSVGRDIIRKGETPILVVPTRAAIILDDVDGRPSPQVMAAGEQGSHRPPDIVPQKVLIFRVTIMLLSPFYQLLVGKGKSIDHTWLGTSLGHDSSLLNGGISHRWDD